MAALRAGEEQARIAKRENYIQRYGLGSGRENGKGQGKGKGAGRGKGGMKEVGDRRGITRGSEGGLGIGMGRDTLGLKICPEELGSEAHVAAAKAAIMLQITVPKGSPGNGIIDHCGRAGRATGGSPGAQRGGSRVAAQCADLDWQCQKVNKKHSQIRTISVS